MSNEHHRDKELSARRAELDASLARLRASVERMHDSVAAAAAPVMIAQIERFLSEQR